MTIYIGADHHGFQQKEIIKQNLTTQGYTVVDCGNYFVDPDDDFTQFAFAVTNQVKLDTSNKGILLCGSGVGVTVAANKVHGIRCGLLFTIEQARRARLDDDINVMALATDYTEVTYAQQLVDTFISTQFSGEERYKRRLEQILLQEQRQ